MPHTPQHKMRKSYAKGGAKKKKSMSKGGAKRVVKRKATRKKKKG
jgi:hypothetical protein|tara:strand:- start:526 stop:660 length:135 start_codon:yes stop_codon:yes gene_type:complete